MKRFVVVFLFFLSTSSLALEIKGGGISSPDPLYTSWSERFRRTDKDVRLSYKVVPRGEVIRSFLDGQYDFMAASRPLTQGGASRMIQIPIAVTGISVVYNIPGLTQPLRLSQDVLGKIFVGQITSWNDPAIRRLNRGVKFPKGLVITPCYQTDPSGASDLFRAFLGRTSRAWSEHLKKSPEPSWPRGIGAPKVAGMIGLVKRNPGAIGYLEHTFAVTNKMAEASLQNSSGRYVLPSVDNLSRTAGTMAQVLRGDFSRVVINPTGEGSYPLTTFSYFLVLKSVQGAKGSKIGDFLRYGLNEGNSSLLKLHFAPLPERVKKSVIRQVAFIGVGN